MTHPLLTFCSISAAVRLVISRFSTRAVSPRKLPPADERRDSKESSNSFSLILKSFCCLVSSACVCNNFFFVRHVLSGNLFS